MSLLDVGRDVASFFGRHPTAVALPAVAAGLIVAHPVRRVSQQFGTSFEGDPNYLRKLAVGGALGSTGLGRYAPGAFGSQPGFGANILTTGNTAGFTTEGSMGLSANPDPDQMLRMSEQVPGTNPSGAIVFGLYSNRLR